MKSEKGTDPPPQEMRYRVRHRTEYRYGAPVAICQNQIRMQPRDRSGVTVESTRTDINPTPDQREAHLDYFGNQVETFAIEAVHDHLMVEVNSQLVVRPCPITPAARSVRWRDLVSAMDDPVGSGWLDVGEFAFSSPRIRTDATLREYALPSFQQHDSAADAAIELTKRIRADFRYDTTATTVETTVAEACRLRAGVCQDFAQVQVGCLRSLGLPARYVSGYLRTAPPPGQSKLIGADESHAWASVFLGHEHGWLDLDPTNGCVVGTDHIPICFGRDYRDVSPMRGVAIGGGAASLVVSVDVDPVES